MKYEDQEGVWPLLVITGKGSNLIGRNWLQKIKINWKNLFQLKEDKITSVKVNKLLEKYEEVFHEELGTFSGPKPKYMWLMMQVQSIARQDLFPMH